MFPLNQNPFELQGYKHGSSHLGAALQHCDTGMDEPGTMQEFIWRVFTDVAQPVRDSKTFFLPMKSVVRTDPDGFSVVGRLIRRCHGYVSVPDFQPLIADLPIVHEDWHTRKKKFKSADRFKNIRRKGDKMLMRANKDILHPGPDYFLLNVPLQGDPIPVPPTMVTETVLLMRRIDQNIERLNIHVQNRFDTHTIVIQLFVVMAVCITILILMMANLDILNPGPGCWFEGSDVAPLKIHSGAAVCSLCLKKLTPYCPDSDVGVHPGSSKFCSTKGRMCSADYIAYIGHDLDQDDVSWCQDDQPVSGKSTSCMSPKQLKQWVVKHPCAVDAIPDAPGEVRQEPVGSPSETKSKAHTTECQTQTEEKSGPKPPSDKEIVDLSEVTFLAQRNKMASIEGDSWDPCVPFDWSDGSATLLKDRKVPKGVLSGEFLHPQEISAYFSSISNIPFGYYVNKLHRNVYQVHVDQDEDRLVSKRSVPRVKQDFVVETAFCGCPWWLNCWMWLTWHGCGIFLLLKLVLFLVVSLAEKWLPDWFSYSVNIVLIIASVSYFLYVTTFHPFFWREYFTFIYVPHLVSAVSGEFERPTTVACAALSARTKVNNLPSFPLKDSVDWLLSRGTEIAVLTVIARTDFYWMGLRNGQPGSVRYSP